MSNDDKTKELSKFPKEPVRNRKNQKDRELSSTEGPGFISSIFGGTEASDTERVSGWLRERDDVQRCAEAFCDLLDRLNGSKRDISIIRDAIMGSLGSQKVTPKWMYLALPYDEYLSTVHWKNLREEKLREAEFRCQLCNAVGVELHVHHRTYERLGHERKCDLIVLCKDCHSHFHDKLKLK